MKTILVVAAAAILGVGSNSFFQDQKKAPAKMQYVFEFGDLESNREKTKKPYIQFLNNPTMHCGVYSLATGATDGQQPHTQDEIYYVQQGQAKISINGIDHDLQPGSVVFVPAHAPHKFHSIRKDLKTLVFFSKVPVKKEQE